MKNFLQIFTSKKMFAVFLTGFSSGIPLALTAGTLQAWMTDEKVDLAVIGFFALVGLPYTFKFLWAPILDRFVPPFLGRRRGWMFITQLFLALCIAAMAFVNPGQNTWLMAALAVGVAFFSASQDIVIDAYRTEILDPEERGVGAGLYIMGYRLAMLVSGALALILASTLSWTSVYLFMSATMIVGVCVSLFGPEPKLAVKPPETMKDAVISPFVEFFKRRGAIEILLFILFYKLGDVMAGALSTPFMMELGFEKAAIGGVNKGFGLVATLVGATMGGAIMMKIGINRSLWVFGILQAVTNLCFMVLAQLGQNYTAMVTAIAMENLAGGMGTAAFSAFMMNLCNARFTATQFALLTSFMATARVFISAPSGVVAKSVGWEVYFLICTACAIPGLLLLFRVAGWKKEIPAAPLKHLEDAA